MRGQQSHELSCQTELEDACLEDDLARGREAFIQQAKALTLEDLGFAPRAFSRYSYLQARKEINAQRNASTAGRAAPTSPDQVAATQHAGEASIQFGDIMAKGVLATHGCPPPTTTMKNSCRYQRLQNLAATDEPARVHRSICGADRTSPCFLEPVAAAQHAGEASIPVEDIKTKGASGALRGPCPPATTTTNVFSRNLFRVQRLQRLAATKKPQRGQITASRPHSARAKLAGSQAAFVESPLRPTQPRAPRPNSLFTRPMHVVQNMDGRARVLVA